MDTLMGFDHRGRSEPIRLLYSIAGREFVDQRVTLSEWPKYKPDTPRGFLPVLKTSRGTINESNTIARYVARELGLCGKDSWEQAVHDCVVENIVEVTMEVGAIYAWKNYNAREPEKSVEDITANYKKCLEYIESVAKERNAKFIVGDEVGLAEAWVYCTLEWVALTLPDAMELTAWTKEFTEKMQTDEKVKKYLDSRPPLPTKTE